MKNKEQKKTKETAVASGEGFVFTRKNYMMMIASVVIVCLGYVLMSGGGAEDPTAFSPDIFNFRRLTLAPITILIGFGIGVFSIFYSPKE
jgi:hypothetical protein